MPTNSRGSVSIPSFDAGYIRMIGLRDHRGAEASIRHLHPLDEFILTHLQMLRPDEKEWLGTSACSNLSRPTAVS
jgi:hypothetical protein